MKTVTTLSDLPANYCELIAYHMPRPIRDDVAYRNTVEVVDALAGHRLTRDQEDYLELLSQLIEAYESTLALPAKKLSGTAALKLLLQEHRMTGEDLAELLGIDRSSAFKILKKRRRLTAEHIKKLVARFKVAADVFLA